MENRNGLCLDIAVDAADGHAERRNARSMFQRVCRRHRLLPETLGADKGYDDGKFLDAVENIDGVIPHVPIKAGAIVAEDEAGHARRRARLRMRNKGYALSQKIRKRVEEVFGWLKTVGGLARARLVGRWKIAQTALATAAAYNLLRIVRLECAR